MGAASCVAERKSAELSLSTLGMKFILIDKSTDSEDLSHAELNLLPALFVLGLIFALAVFGAVVQMSMISAVAGILGTLIVVVFSFLNLYLKLQKNTEN